MTYRILLWFDMLEEEGKSTEMVRKYFINRTPLLSKDFSKGNGGGGGGYIDGGGDGDGNFNDNGNGRGISYNSYGDELGNGFSVGGPKITVVKI